MGNGALAKIGEEASNNTTTGGIKIWRRDEEDLLLVQSILKEEEEYLRKQQLSPNEVEMYLRLYKKGVMKMRDGLIDIVRKDLIPAVRKKHNAYIISLILFTFTSPNNSRTKELDLIQTFGLKLISRTLFYFRCWIEMPGTWGLYIL